MKRFVALSLILLLSALAKGQSRSQGGLVLNGTVVAVSASERKLHTNNKESYVFTVELHMQYRNDGDVPLIVFGPDPFFIERKIEFFNTEGSAISKTFHYVNPFADDGYDPYAPYWRRIDSAQPSRVIQPGGYREFRETFTVEDGYKIKESPAERGRALRHSIPISDYQWLRIEYRLAIKEKSAPENLLQNLQQRWKSQGHLVLDTSGNFTVRSERILNKWGD